MSGCCLVTTTVGSEDAATELAGTLVGEKLAACVQVLGPVRSTYRWNDGVERADEWLCVAKTTAGRQDALIERIRALHKYELPEIVALAIAAGDANYLDWIRRETTV